MSSQIPYSAAALLDSSKLGEIAEAALCTLVLQLPQPSIRLGEVLVQLSQSIEAAGLAEIIRFEAGDTTQQGLALSKEGGHE